MEEDKKSEAMEKLEQAENLMVNTIAETMDLYGVTPSIGRLYGTMYFKHYPMTLDNMKDDLGMSKPSMSTAVRKLQDINIVQKVWQKGSRKDLFVAEKDFFQYFTRFFGKKWEREVAMFLTSITNAEKQLTDILEDEKTEDPVKKIAKLDLEQLREAKKYYRWLGRLVRSIESGEIYQFLPIEEPDEEK